MEQLAKFITDERTGLKYELCGDYYIIAGEDDPEREPIGVWGQRHLRYIQKHSKVFYNKMLTEHTLYDYLLQLNRDAEDTFNHLVKQMAELKPREVQCLPEVTQMTTEPQGSVANAPSGTTCPLPRSDPGTCTRTRGKK